MNEMIIKKIQTLFISIKKEKMLKHHSLGFTILETLVATGIAAIVITSAIGVTGNVYQDQRKIQFSQDFFSESRFLMERISQVARNNTLDYDRYFVEIGPLNDAAHCDDFNSSQIPKENLIGEFPDGFANYDNDVDHRAALGYETIFYWDTDGDIEHEQDRNLGGVDMAGVKDPCAKAWEKEGIIQSLFLINGARTERIAIRRNPSSLQYVDINQNGLLTDDVPAGDYDVDDANFNKLEMQRQLSVDVDGDGKADGWGPQSTAVKIDMNNDGIDDAGETGKPLIYWDDANTECRLFIDQDDNGVLNGIDAFKVVLGENNSEAFCHRAHDFTVLSPKSMSISNLSFSLSPNRDPFLNFRIDEAQIHPQIFISLTTEVREPKSYGFNNVDAAPSLPFQTTVSSRVFGNTRK